MYYYFCEHFYPSFCLVSMRTFYQRGVSRFDLCETPWLYATVNTCGRTCAPLRTRTHQSRVVSIPASPDTKSGERGFRFALLLTRCGGANRQLVGLPPKFVPLLLVLPHLAFFNPFLSQNPEDKFVELVFTAFLLNKEVIKFP